MEKKKARIVMSALSQETRLTVSPTSMSAHLAILSQAGLVKSMKVGRNVIYRALPRVIDELAEFLKSM